MLSVLCDEIKSFEMGWQEILEISDMSELSRQLVVQSVLEIKSRFDKVLKCALAMHESNLKCLANLFQLNHEKEITSNIHHCEVEVSYCFFTYSIEWY